MLNDEKYKRSVSLLCPTCGSDQFEYDDEVEPAESLKCVSCEREFTRDELIEENSENISEHTEEMKKEITKDFAKEMRDTFKKALRGSKNIRFK